MNVPKLLRTTLFSVLALLTTAGLAVAPVQAQDASVTVDADQAENIEDGLEQLNTQLGNTTGGAGELRILANDYRVGDKRVDLTEGASTDDLGNIETLTVVAVGNATSSEVTIERLTIDGGGGSGTSLTTVNFDSESGGFIRVTGEGNNLGVDDFNFTKPPSNSATGDITLSIEGTGSGTSALRLTNDAAVIRGGNTTIASGSANAQYLGNGTVNSLTYNTGGSDLTTTPFFPSSGSVGTLDLNGAGSVDVRSAASVTTLNADAGLDVNGSLTVTGSGLDLNNDISVSATSIDVQGGDLTIDVAGQSVTASSGDLSVGSGKVALSAGETSTTELDVSGALDVQNDITFGDANANVTVEGNVSAGSVTVNAGGEADVTDFDADASGTSFTVDGAVNLSGSDSNFELAATTLSVNGSLTVGSTTVTAASNITSDDISVAGGTLESTNGGITADAGGVGLSAGATFDASGDVSVTSGNIAASGAQTSFTAGGALTVDVASGTAPNALDITDAEFSVNGSGGTSISGTGNGVRAQNGANVSLGDVTFAETDPEFDLADLGSGMNTGVTVGEVTASFTPTTSSGVTDQDFITGGGDFVATALTLNPQDPDQSNSELGSNETSTLNLQVAANSDNSSGSYGNFDIETVTVGEEVNDQDGSGSPDGTYATRVDLDVQEAGSDDDQGRIVASGDEFNTITTDAGGNGTIDITGSAPTTFTGAVTNDGTFTVGTDATFQGAVTNNGTGILSANGTTTAVNGDLTNDGTFEANGNVTYGRDADGSAITGTGTITVASNQTFTIDATGSGLSSSTDVLVNNTVNGDGTLDVNTNVTAVVRSDGDVDLPTTQSNGSGTLRIAVDDGTNTGVSGAITFTGSLTANAPVDFATGSGPDEISSISVNTGSLTAEANVDFTGASYSGSNAVIDVPDLKASKEATVNFAVSSLGGFVEADNVTLGGSSTLNITGNTLRVLKNLTRNNSPNPQLTTDDLSVIELYGTADADVDPGKDVLSFNGTLEVDKDNAQGASVDIVNTIQIDDGGVNIIRPQNNLATTTVNLQGNLIVRNGTFEVSKRSRPGDIVVTTGSNDLVFRDQDDNGNSGVGNTASPGQNVINTGGVIDKINRVTNRSLSGQDVLIKGDTNLEVSGQLRALGGGFQILDTAVLNPSSSGTDDEAAEVVRGFPSVNPSSTQITEVTSGGNSGTFNGAGNTYDLAYNGTGTSTAASELSPSNTRNVAVQDEVTLELDGNKTVSGKLTVGPNAIISDDGNSSARRLTLSGDDTHQVDGVIEGRNSTNTNEVTLRVAGAGATVEGDESVSNDAGGSLIENLEVTATNVTVSDVQQITGDVTVGGDALGSEGGLTLALADVVPSDPNNDPDRDQTITGTVKVGGGNTAGTLTLNDDATVLSTGEVDVNNGTLGFGSNTLTLEDASFAGAASGVSYSGSGTLRMRDTDGDNTSETLAGGSSDLPNLAITFANNNTSGSASNSQDDVTLDGDVSVGGALTLANTVAGDGNGQTLTFKGSATLNPANTNDALTGTDATLRASGSSASISVPDAQVPSNISSGDVGVTVSNLTVADGTGDDTPVTLTSAASSNGTPFNDLQVTNGFALESGTFDHGDANVNVNGGGDFTVGQNGSSIDANAGAYFKLNNSNLTPNFSSGVTIDQLGMPSNFTLDGDGQAVTVDQEVLFAGGQFDANTANDNDALVIANGATIRRAASADPLTEPPTFKGDVAVEYKPLSGNVDFTSEEELPSASGAGTLTSLLISPGSGGKVTFRETSNGQSAADATGNVVVDGSGSVTLNEGSLVHNRSYSSGGDGRRLELKNGSTFFQRDGSISANTGSNPNPDAIIASDYTLVYRPDGSDVTSTSREFLGGGAVSTLRFEDAPVNSGSNTSNSSKNLTLGSDKTVGSLVVDRTGSSSQFDLNDGSSNTLIVDGTAEVAAGEVTGGTLDSDGTSGALANSSDLLIDGTVSSAVQTEGKTTVRSGGTLSGDASPVNGEIVVNSGGSLTSGTVSTDANITVNGTLDIGTSLTTSADILASNASSVEFEDATFDGSANQRVEVSGDPTPTTLTLDKSAPSSGGPPVVTFSGSEVNLTDGSGDVLNLNGGLLKPTGSTNDVDDNLVDLGGGDFSRDLSGSNTASASHVVGGVTTTVSANPNNAEQPIYPVGSEDPAVYRRYRFTFPTGEVGDKINITVNHITEKLANTDPLPVTDNTGVTIGTDFPAYYWQVTADRDLPLTSNYEVSAQVTDQSLTFSSEKPSSDYRLLLRNRSDQPQNTTWKLVGDGSGYANEGPVDGVVDIRSQSATADVTNLGRVFTVGVPTGPGPAIVTNEGLTLTEGETTSLAGVLEAQDDNNSASELTYTVTTAPTNGELQDGSGNVIGKGGTFTQADINNGNVSYAASSAGDDSFDFEVSDSGGSTVSGTFNVTVEQGTVSISGTVTYPTESSGSLGGGTGIGGVTVEASANGSVAGTATTNSDGTFTITGLEAGQYDVTASVSKTVDGGDVNSTDALRIVLGFVGRTPFVASFQEEVADVTVDGTANSRDALQAARFGSGLSIPSSSKIGGWFSTTTTVDVSGGDQTGVAVQAARYGDARLNNGPNGGNSVASLSSGGAQKDVGGTEAEGAETSVQAGKTFEVPVRVSGADEVGAYNLTLDYPADKASFKGVVGQENVITNASEDGTLRLSWFDRSGGEEPIVLSGSKSTLVTLRFKADGDAEDTFRPEITEGQVAAPDATPITGARASIPASRIGVTPDKFALKGSAPNPVTDAGQAQILMDLPKQATVKVEVYNVLGQRVARMESDLSAGAGQSVQLNGVGLPSGQYFYRVSAEMSDETVQETGRMTVVN